MAGERNGAAPAGGGAAAAGASGAENLGTGEEIEVGAGAGSGGFKDAFAAVREKLGIGGEGGDGGEGSEELGGGGEGGEGEEVAALPAETPEEREARLEALSPEEREAAIAEEERLAAEDVLVVDLGPMREGEEPIRIAAEDQAMADHIRSLVNRAATRDVSMRIREEAEAIRAQADEMRYEVHLDPAGFLLQNLKGQDGSMQVDDAAHVAKVLLTQPGVLASIKEWVVALANTPQALAAEARLANADRIERQQKAQPLVERMKFENKNARQCVRAAYNAIDAIVPESWSGEQRDALVGDIVADLRNLQFQENVSVTDPRRVKGLVERRLARFGVAPRGAKPAAGAGAGRPGSKTPARTGPSGQQLRATDSARRRAAGPGTGQGSPVAGIPKPPAGTKLTGKNNVFDFVRQHLPALKRAPR